MMGLGKSAYHRLTSHTARKRYAAWWRRLSNAMNFAFKAIPVLIVVLLFVQYFRESVVIRPFSVTKALSDEGITDAVAAEELRQRVYAIYQRAALNDRAGTGIALTPELPDITVPETGVSINSIFDAIAAVVPWNRRTIISGAFTGDAGRLRLTVLVGDRQVYPDNSVATTGTPDALLDAAADAVVEKTRPISRAFDLLGRHQEPEANRFLTAMIDRSPDSGANVAEAYEMRGMIFMNERRLDEACAQFFRSLQIAPNQFETHRMLSILLANEGELDRATAEAQQAVVLSWGRDAWAYYELGNRYYTKQRWRDADLAYSNSIALWFGDPFVHDALGDLRLKENDADRALREYDTAIALNDAYAQAYVDRGQLFIRNRRLGDAKADFLRAQRLDPAMTAANNGLGQVYYELGQYGAAGNAFRASLRINPGDSYAYGALRSTLTAAPTRNPREGRAVAAAFSATTVCRAGKPVLGPIAADPSLKNVVAVTCRQATLTTSTRAAADPVCQADPPDASPFHVASAMQMLPSATMFHSLAFADFVWQHAAWILLTVVVVALALLAWRRMRPSAGRR